VSKLSRNKAMRRRDRTRSRRRRYHVRPPARPEDYTLTITHGPEYVQMFAGDVVREYVIAGVYRERVVGDD
jgi:hypothetical protein